MLLVRLYIRVSGGEANSRAEDIKRVDVRERGRKEREGEEEKTNVDEREKEETEQTFDYKSWALDVYSHALPSVRLVRSQSNDEQPCQASDGYRNHTTDCIFSLPANFLPCLLSNSTLDMRLNTTHSDCFSVFLVVENREEGRNTADLAILSFGTERSSDIISMRCSFS